MNKKIKTIELLNKIANGEEVPEKIKIRGNTLKWIDVEGEKGYKVIDKNSIFYWLQDIISLDSIEDLNDEVEILEDNTEEIEELKRTENVYDMTLECYHDIEKEISNDELADKINEIIRYIKRKDKSND